MLEARIPEVPFNRICVYWVGFVWSRLYNINALPSLQDTFQRQEARIRVLTLVKKCYLFFRLLKDIMTSQALKNAVGIGEVKVTKGLRVHRTLRSPWSSNSFLSAICWKVWSTALVSDRLFLFLSSSVLLEKNKPWLYCAKHPPGDDAQKENRIQGKGGSNPHAGRWM